MKHISSNHENNCDKLHTVNPPKVNKLYMFFRCRLNSHEPKARGIFHTFIFSPRTIRPISPKHPEMKDFVWSNECQAAFQGVKYFILE